jgi:predicted dehydrogenase
MADISRREAALGLVALTGGAALARGGRPLPDKVRLGFIGVGNRGSQLLQSALSQPDAEVTAVCDVYAPYNARAIEKIGKSVPAFGDFRKLLERPDVDAVVIATPDHWHAIQTIMACEAGKDVYVEKPLAITIVEGRRMVEAARRTKRIVLVGLQRRSSSLYAEIGTMVRDGMIGKVTLAQCHRINNMWPKGIGRAPDSPPPPDLDWDMWLGPRPKRPFRANIAPYKFRWWKAYSSQVGNWGVHYFDAIRWVLGETGPVSVSAHGGRFAVDDDRDIPDTMEAIFEFASGRLLTFGQYEASGVPALRSGEVELRGTLGALYVGSGGYEVVPDRGGQFQDWQPKLEARKVPHNDGNLDDRHMANFLQCVRSRAKPACDVEEGHLSTVFAHLANIALATRSRIEWDMATERITNNRAANTLLHYRYRAPWRLA